MEYKIRICQPFDQVCLQGGCLWCQDHPKSLVSDVRRIAREKGWEADLDYGLARNLSGRKR
jgi:hypothetical protein